VRVYLDVDTTESGQAEAGGARWDPTQRQWYVDNGG
jgi:uncharacterized protein DUF5710